ncbi:unnamed protein product [Fraxinus pennsylvanica]|uniref:PPPDE domain-containing protein n=1 Tax=Fraxinus pennsylvanica TaxID=56036 RepID=A0AAD1ZQD5_9LAMI|nr:unnamed protein product [Fraxinus pennsylvanica]
MIRRRRSTKRGGRGDGSVPVYLNVYDLTSINGYAYWLGLGVYHSGIQVHAVEYAFGAHESSTTGIFEGEPKHCEGFIFRKSILMGWTDMTPGEVRGVMEEFAQKYRGNAYNLITKNCNHFCNDACIKLTGNSIPSWVNRLARIVNLKLMKVGHLKIEDKVCEGEEKNLRSSSSQSHSSPLPTTTASRSRSCSQGSSTP